MLTGKRLKNAFKTLLVLIWVLMIILLVRKVHFVPSLPDVSAAELPGSETWMSIHMKGQKIGYSVQSITRLEQEYIVDSKTYMRLNLLGRVQEIRTVTSARLNRAMDLKSFHFFLSAGPVRFQVTGVLSGLNLDLTTLTSGYKNTTRIKLKEVPRLSIGIIPYLAQEGFKKGQRHRLALFDPSTLSSRQVDIVVEDTERLLIEGVEVDAYRIRMDYFDTQSYVWVDSTGQTLKEEGLLGMSMIKTTPEEARKGLAGRASLFDVVRATSAGTNRTIKDPRSTIYLKVRLKGVNLKGFELDGGRQRLDGDIVEIFSEKIDVRDEKLLPMLDSGLKSYLKSTDFIQSRDPRIIRQSRSIAAGLKSPLKIMDKIMIWVYENLEKRPTLSIPSAVEVLEMKVGDCNEHSVLAAALLRAAGVPTRMAVGVFYFEDRFYYHSWIEAYWGKWLAFDPVLGQSPADATHIRFMTGGLSRQVEMVRVIGRLEVEILEVK